MTLRTVDFEDIGLVLPCSTSSAQRECAGAKSGSNSSQGLQGVLNAAGVNGLTRRMATTTDGYGLLTAGGFTPDKTRILKENSTLRFLVRAVANVVKSVDEWSVSGEREDRLHPPSGKPGYFSTSRPAWLSLR